MLRNFQELVFSNFLPLVYHLLKRVIFSPIKDVVSDNYTQNYFSMSPPTEKQAIRQTENLLSCRV